MRFFTFAVQSPTAKICILTQRVNENCHVILFHIKLFRNNKKCMCINNGTDKLNNNSAEMKMFQIFAQKKIMCEIIHIIVINAKLFVNDLKFYFLFQIQTGLFEVTSL